MCFNRPTPNPLNPSSRALRGLNLKSSPLTPHPSPLNPQVREHYPRFRHNTLCSPFKFPLIGFFGRLGMVREFLVDFLPRDFFQTASGRYHIAVNTWPGCCQHLAVKSQHLAVKSQHLARLLSTHCCQHLTRSCPGVAVNTWPGPGFQLSVLRPGLRV
jgi:hypothetical protein